MRKKQKLPWLWPAVGLMIALLWAWYFAFQSPHWVSVLIGFVTGGMFMAFASEVTDDKPFGSPPSDPRDGSRG